ncbi:hypothetical protein SEA_RIZWANA_56 [Arthrobacter phage Rizwana]|nr:hypothetical protein SEA_RIZWANA_56 [Arthrobacter phage Rizwana]
MVFDGVLFNIDQIQSASTVTEKGNGIEPVTRVRVYFLKGGSVALNPRWRVEDFSAFLAAAQQKKIDTITVGQPTP